MATDEDKSHYQQLYDQWITELGISIGRPTNDHVYSESVYTHPNGMGISVIQPKDQTDRIILTTRLNIPLEVQQSIMELQEEQQQNLINDLKYGLLQMGVQFGLPMQNNMIQAIALERTIFGESLNKQIFFDNLYRIIDGLVFLQTKMHERLGSRIARTSNTSAYG